MKLKTEKIMRCIECGIPLTADEESWGRCDECRTLSAEATEEYLDYLGDLERHARRDEE